MLKIDCPFCGPRDEVEFRCGGQSHIARPGLDCSDADWAQYLFQRDNPRGWHFERWLHAYGCRQWFNIARNTVTHEIRHVYPVAGAKPALSPDPSPASGRGEPSAL